MSGEGQEGERKRTTDEVPKHLPMTSKLEGVIVNLG